MKKKFIWVGVLLIVLIVCILAGCGRQQGETPETEQPAVTSSSENGEAQPTGNSSSVDTGKEELNTGEGETNAESGQAAQTESKNNKNQTQKTSTGSNRGEGTGEAGSGKTGSPEKPQNDNLTTLKVTRDFGSKVIFQKRVKAEKGWTVLDLLEANLDIATDWDGGFISEINGLKNDQGGLSGKRLDWFYYINGICSDAGADGYTPAPGEVIWWDYHAWENMGSAISAVIGCYPEPFLHGYREKVGKTTLLSSSEHRELAKKLQTGLKNKGVKTVEIANLDGEKMSKRTGPVMVIGDWQELKKITWLEKFNQAYKKTGTGVHFTDQGIELIRYNGEVKKTVTGSVGVILATGEGLGDNSPLWLITGTDTEGFKQAVELLAKSPGKIAGMYNAAVVSGEVVRLPLP